jgi:uncharacterized protein (DUF3084 family)
MYKDCEQMRERLRAMNEQKVFLCDQLKALMKRNKILQAEIDSVNLTDSISAKPSLISQQNSTQLRGKNNEVRSIDAFL